MTEVVGHLRRVQVEFAELLGVLPRDIKVRFLAERHQIHGIAGRVNFVIDYDSFASREALYREVLCKFNTSDFRFRRPYKKAAA